MPINMNTNEDLWVVLNVLASAGASPSETFSSQITAPADVNSLTGGGQVLFGTAAPTAATLKVIHVSYTHLRAHETVLDIVCRPLLEKNNKKKKKTCVSCNNDYYCTYTS